jgi:glucokinase
VAPDCVIGVDLGGTKLLAGAVDDRLGVHHRATREAQGGDRDAVLGRIEAAIREAMDAAPGPVRAVGLGVPSLVDVARGVAVFTNHLPIADVPLRDLMAERLGVPVAVDNDATCAMVGEHRFGAARGASTAALLTLGTGIGGSLVAEGAVVRGATGAAGEWGHMVVEVDGLPCPGNCPNHGCLETIASGPALARLGAEAAASLPGSGLARAVAAGREMNGPLVTELAAAGDAAALDCLRAVGEALGVGISNVVNILNPEVVVVGGGVIAAGDLLLDPARETVRARALSPSKDVVSIVPTRFGAESGMLGAAVLAFDLAGVEAVA